jgi:very-short-patch-repair endonuclease
MRREPTPSENILWQHVRRSQLGVRFRRQHIIGPTIVDFYCASAALVVEVDGSVHDSPDAQEHDRIRDEALGSLGLCVIRVKTWLVERDIDAVFRVLRAALADVRPSE